MLTLLILALSVGCCHGYSLQLLGGRSTIGEHQRCSYGARMMAAAKKPKAKAKKQKARSGGGSGGGFGGGLTKTAVSSGPTPDQLLKRSTDLYSELESLRAKTNAAEAEAEYGEGADDDEVTDEAAVEQEGADKTSITRWALTLRTAASDGSFSDWVPVALANLACSTAADPAELMSSAVGASVKEIFESGCQTIPSLRKVARETVQYGFEPVDSFETHVYSGLENRGERRLGAAATLGIESGASAAEVKKAHRRLMVELHPDTFIGDEEGAEAAKERMLEVQEAYAELGGGTGGSSGSFYESIGGKARVDFSGALSKDALVPLGKQRPEQEAALEEGGWRVGVMPMMREITQEFVTRNLARAE